MKDLPSDWIIFEEISSFNTKKFIKNCTVVSPISVALFSNAMRLPQDPISKMRGKFIKRIHTYTELFLTQMLLYYRR